MKKYRNSKMNKRAASIITAIVMLSSSMPISDISNVAKNLFNEIVVFAEEVNSQTNGEEEIESVSENTELFQADADFPIGYDGKCIINSYEELVQYSVSYQASPDIYQNANIVLALTNTGGSLEGFQSIGTNEYPFSGDLEILYTGLNAIIQLNDPFFDYITDTSSIIVSGGSNTAELKLSRPEASKTPLFANNVVHNANASDTASYPQWKITVDEGSDSFSGIIGTINESAKVNLEIKNNANAITSSGNAGLVCGTMKSGSEVSASVTGSGISYSVTADSGNAGGIVGEMESGSQLTVNSDINIPGAITTNNGYAGGIAGKAVNASVIFTDISAAGEDTVYPKVTATVSGTSGSGGVYGYYETAENAEITVSNYNTDCTLNDGNAGGIFGELVNKGTITIDGTNTVTANRTSGGNNDYGGLIGKYSSNSSANALNVTGMTVKVSKEGTAGSYGGITGEITDDSYINISGVTVSAKNCKDNVDNFGGVAGKNSGGFIDAENVTINTNGDFKGGGIVGNMDSGVLRLSGTTDLSSAKADSGGQIVGTRGNQALIYAQSGWKLIRSKETEIDDIGTWGEVLRFSETDFVESNVLNVDESAHTVTVKKAETTISSLSDFAILALNNQMNNGAPSNNTLNTLLFEDTTVLTNDLIMTSTITLNANIDLTGTGITGLTRDDGKDASGSVSKFSATFTGGTENHTITLAIGEPYGYRENIDTPISKDDTSAGNGIIYRHQYLGLFAKTDSNAAFENITIDGIINADVRANFYIGGISGEHTSGNITFNNVTSKVKCSLGSNSDSNIVYCGGLIGRATLFGIMSITGSTISPVINTEEGKNFIACTGGAIGEISSLDSFTIKADSVTIGAKITNNSNNASKRAGSFIAYIANAEKSSIKSSARTISLNNINVTKAEITSNNSTMGGALLGELWNNVDVTFGGVTVTDSTVKQNGTGGFAGLVSIGSGYWQVNDVDINGITVNSDTAKSFGMFVNTGYFSDNGVNKALYLELTNENAYMITANKSSKLNSNAVFDELVTYGSSKAVVSIHTTTPDGESEPKVYMDGVHCNTYQNQTKFGNKYNSNIRYYYNLDVIRAKGDNLSNEEKLLMWSVETYTSYDNVKKLFWNKLYSGNTTTFPEGTYDMIGYSYYPIDFSYSSHTIKISNSTFIFYNKQFEDSEDAEGDEDNYQRLANQLDNKTQHNLMQCGLFISYNGILDVDNVTFKGNISKALPKSERNYYADSGVLICGTAKNFTANIKNVKFDGICVNDADNSNTSYAPLLINKVDNDSTITIDGVSVANEGSYTDVIVAAGSLIGNAGGPKASNIKMVFKNIKLDGRTQDLSNTEANTALTEAYHTTRSIFKNSTLLNALMYPTGSNCSAVYNYRYEEDWDENGDPLHNVTYGREINNTVEYRDEDDNSLENKYMGSDYFTSPESAKASSKYIFFTAFLPYVKEPYKTENNTWNAHEVRVNVPNKNLDSGCGTYNDPYIIKERDQLMLAADILGGATTLTDGTVINYHSDNYNSWCDNKNDTSHTVYVWSDDKFYPGKLSGDEYTADTSGESFTLDDMKTALSTAYYKLDADITLGTAFVGLGKTTPFMGVIDGGNHTITNESVNPLIYNSKGSVVKDLQLTVKGSFTGTQGSVSKYLTDSNGGTQFYGGLIGIVNGGDNIIDNVGISFDESVSVKVSGDYAHLIAVGGYIGVVRYGGVIFRNMKDNVNKGGLEIGDDNKYLYQNPVIGRVLDGFAVTESDRYKSEEEYVTMRNGSKNYSIADINKNSEQKLSFSQFRQVSGKSASTVTVPDSQSLFLMGCIAMSGAGKYKISDSKYNDNLLGYGNNQMIRHADYNSIGTITDILPSEFVNAAMDCYSNDENTVPYIIYKYTDSNDGSYPARTLTSNNTVFTIQLAENGKYLLPEGFRGIGSINSTADSSQMYIYGIIGNGSTITQNTQYNLYQKNSDNYDSDNAGLGLFNKFFQNRSDCLASGADLNSEEYKISNLTLSGNVELKRYDTNGTEITSYDNSTVSAGGLAGICSGNSSIQLENIVLNNLTVSSPSVSGGLIGFISGQDISTTADLKCISADNLTVSAKKAAGGIAGKAEKIAITFNGLKTDNANTEFKINTISLTGTGDTPAEYYAGGLFGFLGDQSVMTLINMDIKPCEANEAGKICAENNAALGGLIGAKYGGQKLEIDSCNVIDVKISGGSQCAGIIARAAYDDSVTAAPDVMIKNTHVVGKTNGAVIESSCTGDANYAYSAGIAGYYGSMEDSSVNILTIDNCSVENYTIISANSEGCSGLIGKTVNRSAVIKNSIVKNCTLKGDSSIGGFIADNSGTGITGYNLVSQNVEIMNIDGTESNNAGDIVGNNNGRTLKLAGVSVQKSDTGIYAPVSVGGTFTPANGYVIYSDINGTCLKADCNTESSSVNAENNADDHGSFPYATINPKTYIDSTMFLTGDGASQAISDAIKNDTDYSFDYKDKLSTFNSELNTGIRSDFPVLIVNDSEPKNVTKMINDYIHLLTNDSSISDYAKDDADKYNVVISHYKYEDGGFKTSDVQTLLRTNGNQFKMSSTDYDNSNNQFTLLDIQYKDPSDSNKIAYHLYIPIMVEKMLKFDFTASVLSGTTYKASEYNNRTVMESYGTTVTAYVTYSYQRTVQEWQDAINVGENILDSYGKSVLLNYLSTSELPDNTNIVLVDCNNNDKVYYSTISGACQSGTKIIFDNFTSNGNHFNSVLFYDILSESADINAAENTEGKFVKCTEADMALATVKTTGESPEYYRLKTENDETAALYDITITQKSGIDLLSGGILPVKENYYLSFFTEAENNTDMVNVEIKCDSSLEDSSKTPSHIRNSKSAVMIMGNLYSQTFGFQTNNEVSNTEMSEYNRIIYANMTSTLSIQGTSEEQSAIKGYLNDPSIRIYHGFIINMNITENGIIESGVKGTPLITGSYTINEDTQYPVHQNSSGSVILLTGDTGGSVIRSQLASAGSLTISCDVSINYVETADIIEQFPVRSDNSNGVSLSASSKLAYVPDNIIYSNISDDSSDKNAKVYYRQGDVKVASLNYNIPTGTSDADEFSKLGVNGKVSSEHINAVGYYDVSNIPEDDFERAAYVSASLSLLQKGDDGSYSNVPINEYLTDLKLNDVSVQNNTFDKDDLTLENKIFKITSSYTVITGDDFEESEKLYSNYRVLMTVKLLDANGDEITNSICSDYITYTNAKIFTELLPNDVSQSSAS